MPIIDDFIETRKTPLEGTDSRCRCGWVFLLRLPEHGSCFICPCCHRVEWGES